MSPEVRIRRLEQQKAHLKVLLETALEQMSESQRNLAAWTKRLLLSEAEVGTFQWRIEEVETELDQLRTKIAPKGKRRG